MHISVLKNELVSVFEGMAIHTFVDGTLGAGGHSLSLLENHPEIERLIGIDQDPKALEIAKEVLNSHSSKMTYIQANFATMEKELRARGISQVDGIILDIGVSSMQFDDAERGFSFQTEAHLDMRMGPHIEHTAAYIINSWEEKDLADLFYTLGEERASRRIASLIVKERTREPILTTLQLADLISSIIPRRSGIHPATKVFQALRIEVNRELEVLTSVIPQAVALLEPGGRLAIISFHSLEDRIVKHTFRSLHQEGKVTILTKKPIEPSSEELSKNRRCRSAKLRAIQKLP